MSLSSMQWLSLYAKVVEISAVAAGLLFVIQWTWYSPWWRDIVGRTVIAEAAAVLLSIMPGLVESFFDLTSLEKEELRWFNVSAVALIPIIYIWRVYVWHRLPHTGKNLMERWRARRIIKGGTD